MYYYILLYLHHGSVSAWLDTGVGRRCDVRFDVADGSTHNHTSLFRLIGFVGPLIPNSYCVLYDNVSDNITSYRRGVSFLKTSRTPFYAQVIAFFFLSSNSDSCKRTYIHEMHYAWLQYFHFTKLTHRFSAHFNPFAATRFVRFGDPSEQQ